MQYDSDAGPSGMARYMQQDIRHGGIQSVDNNEVRRRTGTLHHGGQMQCRMIAYIPGGYEKAGRVYDPSYASPTVQSRDYKDPIRVAVDDRGHEERRYVRYREDRSQSGTHIHGGARTRPPTGKQTILI